VTEVAGAGGEVEVNCTGGVVPTEADTRVATHPLDTGLGGGTLIVGRALPLCHHINGTVVREAESNSN